MPITTRSVPNVGSPADDPSLLLPGTLYIPDSSVHPPPWPCVVGCVANDFSSAAQVLMIPVMTDLANAGFLSLFSKTRLMNNPIPGQTTDGKYHQQTDDLKIAVRAMRTDPFGFGYSVTGYVAAVGGSGSAHHALWMALEGTLGVDKVDAAICLSPPTDFSDREADVVPHIITVVTGYGRTTDLPTLLARSPISLTLSTASPILHYNGNAEAPGMPLSMWTRFKNAMVAAGGTGAAGYTAIENFGTLGAQHSFKMWVDGTGFTGIGPDAIAWLLTTVTPPPPPIPNPPSSLTATAISESAIDLGWTDNSANEDGFKIERSLDSSIWTEIFETAPNIVVYHDTGLSSGTLYYYRVRAFNAGGDSAYSNTASATTNSPLPGTLHTPTFTPTGSVDSFTDTTIACSDAGAHIFYTLGASPPDPTHTGDTPTGFTFRIGSNSGTKNSGFGVNQFKALAYETGFIDSDIAVSDTFGTPPVTNLKPILTGIGQLLSSDRVDQPLGNIDDWLFWDKPWVDFLRYRGAWNMLEPTEGAFFWDELDYLFAKAAAKNKFISLSISAGTFTPQWVYDSGAFKYGPIHDPNYDPGSFQPLPWDPAYQAKWFAFLNELAARYAGNDQLRAMIDCGFMPINSMSMGDLVDEAAMPFSGTGFDYPDIHSAYRGGAQAILSSTFTIFPNIGHAITYVKVWPDDNVWKDAQSVRDFYKNAFPDRAGTIVTSLRATLPPHAPPDLSHLVKYPSYAQQFRNMTVPDGVNHYNPQPDPVPLPPPLTCLQDCLETCWTNGQQYLEVYRADVEFDGVDDTFTIEREKIIANLVPPDEPPPPVCPPGQHWDPSKQQCVPDLPPPLTRLKGVTPILENATLGSDIDFQNHYILNPGMFIPCPEGILAIDDIRLSDNRTVLDGSVTNQSVWVNAAIDQSKLNLNVHIPGSWTGHNSNQAAPGNNVQFLSEKGQPDGYVPLRSNGTFDPAFLASTGPQTGTVTSVGLYLNPPFFPLVNPVTTSGGFTGGMAAPAHSWMGINGGLGFESDIVPSFLTKQFPDGLIPALPASKITTGTLDREMLPVAIGMGVGHTAGVVPDTGIGTASGSEKDYLGRDMEWHSFEATPSPQPSAPEANVILQSYYLGQGSIRIRSPLNGSNLFYRVIGGFSGEVFSKAPSTDYTFLADVGKRVDAYVAKAGYNNSKITSFTVPEPQST